MGKLLKNRIFSWMILLILLISLLVRFYDLEMDPFTYDAYGLGWSDEGSWAHNARNKILFGEWKTEGEWWNPMYISPIMNYLEFISFGIFGVNTFAMRLVPSLLGVISILLAGLLFMLKKREEGIIYVVLLSINAMLIAFSRTAMIECIVLFFILVILGLVNHDKKYSWILAGFFVPFLFFSKFTSIFFILSVPLSLILYYLLYRSKQTLKNLLNFVFGAVISTVIWLFWLIPIFDEWIFLNFGLFDSRIYINLFKFAGVSLYSLKFFLLSPLIFIFAIVSIFFTVISLKKKQKIPFIDFLLVISLVIFLLQATVLDFPLRRFVLILPIVLLIAAKFICKLKDITFRINNKLFKLNKIKILSLIILIYFLVNITPVGFYFSELSVRYDESHMFIRNSKEINNYIPPGSNVYGNFASALRLENKIKPYLSSNTLRYADTQDQVASFFNDNEIDYAILIINVFDENDLKKVSESPGEVKSYNFLQENFEIYKVLNSKDHRNNNLDRKIYIYKRI